MAKKIRSQALSNGVMRLRSSTRKVWGILDRIRSETAFKRIKRKIQHRGWIPLRVLKDNRRESFSA